MNAENTYIDEWLSIARKDWKRIFRHLAGNDPEAGGFFLQQCIEKYMKAFMLQKGWTLKKIHVLPALLRDAIAYDPSLDRFMGLCEKVSELYMVSRYPLPAEASPSLDEIQALIPDARNLILSLFPGETLDVDEKLKQR